jgi:hypothetical protein
MNMATHDFTAPPAGSAPLTFEEFRALGRDVADLSEIIEGQEELEGKPGRVYTDHSLYVEREPDGRWFLIIENQDWIGMSLVDMERRLYQYGLDSGLWARDSEEEAR